MKVCKRRWWPAALAGAAVVWGTVAVAGPDQVARGQQIFQQSCMACHGARGQGGFEAPAVNGRRTRARFANAQKMYDFVRQWMPFNSPGSLSPDQYWDAVAYILSLQGVPLDGMELGPANAAGITWDRAEVLVQLGSRRLFFDVPPVIEGGRTLVPLRPILEELGADVAWDAATRTVTATRRGVAVRLQIDHPVAWVSGREVPLEQPPVIRGGRTLVPVRFVSEALGARVEWDGATRTVIIEP